MLATTMLTATTVAGQRMFSSGFVADVACVASSIATLITAEVIEGSVSTIGERTVVSVMRIPAVIDVTIESARTMEPWACADEDAISEPIWTVVAVGRAIVRSIVEVAVRAHRSRPDIHSDGNLGGSLMHGARKQSNEKSNCKTSDN